MLYSLQQQSHTFTSQTADNLLLCAVHPAKVHNCKNVQKQESIARLQVGHPSQCNGYFNRTLSELICNAPSGELKLVSVLLAYPQHVRNTFSTAVLGICECGFDQCYTNYRHKQNALY